MTSDLGVQRRLLLMHSRLDDPAQKIMFADGHWIHVEGSGAAIDEDGDTIYLGLGVRNAGAGIAVLQGGFVGVRWGTDPRTTKGRETARKQVFRLLTRMPEEGLEAPTSGL
jgi:hypothetical protein